MNVVQTARKAVFGETWALPIAVALLIGAAELLRQAAPRLWHDAGGLLLLAGTACVLVTLVQRGRR